MQYTAVGCDEAKGWMIRHLLVRYDSIPWGEIDVMVEEWGKGVNFSALDPRIVKIEAAWLAKQYKLSHVKELGNFTPTQPDGVLR